MVLSQLLESLSNLHALEYPYYNRYGIPPKIIISIIGIEN